MLPHTFCHLPGIGESIERSLWRDGITSWESALVPDAASRSTLRSRLPDDLLRESLQHYERSNAHWFGRCLPSRQLWRLFHHFRDSCAYLDIETTGLQNFGHITTIALYDGRTIRTYVQGHNLDQFQSDIRDYRLLVTYNGKSFDLPFIARDLGLKLDQPHIDLRYLLASLGLKGGLKGCERQVGLSRPGLEDVDGFVAVLLWDDFRRRRDERSLETLLAYNVQDTINLESLLVLACNRKLAELEGVSFAADYHVTAPTPPANPHQADPATVRRVIREYPGPWPLWR
jgi:uncharacterized protein YprB with RNaseH-like and TPR domain